MRILWVKAGKLLPVDTGGKIRSYNLLRQLAARHELVLLSYYGGRRDRAYEDAIAQQFPAAFPVWDRTPQSGLQLYTHYGLRLASPAPYAVSRFTSTKVKRAVAQWMSCGHVDVAVCDFLSASRNFPARLETPSVLFQHNVESVLWRRQAAHELNAIKRRLFALEAAKMERYERKTVRRFQRVIAVSDSDRREMASMTDPHRISVVPTGVDLEQYRAAAGFEAGRPVVTFLGSMDWEANIDAVDYFVRDMWPSILAEVPDAIFRIVGRSPHSRVQRLASASVEVTGTVPSVIDYLRDTAVLVVPLRIGGGTRLKIFEAMAAGRAIVSTSIGAEGLDVSNGRDIVLSDTPHEFARSVISLLKDADRRRPLEQAAVETAARHDWPVIAERFEGVLRQAIAERHGVRGVAAEAAGAEA